MPSAPLPLSEAIGQFLDYLGIDKERSPKTLENYRLYLSRLQSYMDAQRVPDTAGITPVLVRGWRKELAAQTDKQGLPLTSKTIAYHLVALRGLLRWCVKNDVAALPPDKIELPKGEMRQVEALNRDELDRLLAAPDTQTLLGARDAAILQMLYSTGLRVTELCSLRVRDVDFATGEFAIRGKGRKLRVVFISPAAADAMRHYWALREAATGQPLAPDAPAYTATKGPKRAAAPKKKSARIAMDGMDDARGLTRASIATIVRQHTLAAGLVKDVTPHTLRHTFATLLLQAGADLRTVQEMLGHSNISTTQVYTHVTNAGLREAHKKFHK